MLPLGEQRRVGRIGRRFRRGHVDLGRGVLGHPAEFRELSFEPAAHRAGAFVSQQPEADLPFVQGALAIRPDVGPDGDDPHNAEADRDQQGERPEKRPVADEIVDEGHASGPDGVSEKPMRRSYRGHRWPDNGRCDRPA